MSAYYSINANTTLENGKRIEDARAKESAKRGVDISKNAFYLEAIEFYIQILEGDTEDPNA